MHGFGISHRLLCIAHFWLRHHFQQRRTRTVQINACIALHRIVYRFARIFFHVRTGHVDGFDFIAHHDVQFTKFHNRVIHLADLIAFWQVGVKIVFAVKNIGLIDGGFQSQAQFDAFFNHRTVHHGQSARHGQVHHRSVGIGIGTKRSGCAAENFRLRVHLDVDFQSNYGFPSHVLTLFLRFTGGL